MQKEKDKTFLDKAARVISAVFSPLVVPTLACAITFMITSLAHFNNETFRFMACLIVFAITTGIPVAALIYLIRTGRVSNADITDRRQRSLTYAIACVCYMFAAVYLSWVGLPRWLAMFFCGASFATIVTILINLAWKISAHAIAMGGFTALITYIAIDKLYIVLILPWLAATILASGLVGSARLRLNRHTPLQVYAGWCMGLGVELLFLFLS